MIQLRKVVSSLLTFSTAVTLSGIGMVASAYASPLTETQVQLSDVRSTLSSTYTISFKVAQTTNIKGFRFIYSTTPSGSAVEPTSMSTTGASISTFTKNGSDISSGWTLGASTDGTLDVTKAAGTGALSAGDLILFTFAGINNTDATTSGGNQCDSVANSETCYVRITTYNTDTVGSFGAGTTIDTSVGSYTVISPVTVTATIDPSLTFTLTGVASGSLAGNDANANCSSNVTSTATTVPFGNVAVNTPKCGQHSLAVATNAQNGYKTYNKFIGTSPNLMTGTISSSNVVNPYTGTFGTPTAWTAQPTGTTTNTNTAWIGMRVVTPGSQSPGIGGFNGSDLYAGPAVNSTSTLGNTVMNSSGPDLGTSVTYVTYKFWTNALAPADTYTGTMVYNAIAKY